MGKDSVAERIYLALNGRSLNWLQKEAGFGAGYASRLAGGQRPNPRPVTLKKLATALGVSYEWLATGEGPMVAARPVEPDVENDELAKAVYFLRGDLPDEFLDGWLKANNDQGWRGVTRRRFLTMLEEAYDHSQKVGEPTGAEALSTARAKKISGRSVRSRK